ncbi:MAG: hypothetical protein K2G03_05965, partial [Bacilli bacterium]|nr:hypothetical protein [Bacilli bacterium]
GKFETGYLGATSKEESQVNEEDSSKIIIKPNVYSWRKNTVYNFFVSSYNYERTLDSHMMKNTEWGAVAYLSHSRYGIDKEVNINNNNQFKTGYSSYPNTDQSKYPGTSGDGGSYNAPYNTSVGYLASTTGNITGVYDMSGGAHEYMASHISGKLGKSGFTEETIASYSIKYFDVYNNVDDKTNDRTTYNYRILGDATGEIGPFSFYADADGTKRWHSMWYGDFSTFLHVSEPWFDRGGDYNNGVTSGQFYFSRYSGDVINYLCSRLVLVG